MVVCRYVNALKASPALSKLESLQKTKLPIKLSLYVLVFMVSWTGGINSCRMYYSKDILFFFWRITNSPCNMFVLSMVTRSTMAFTGGLNAIAYGIANSTLRKNYTWWQLVYNMILSPLLLVPYFLWYLCKAADKKVVCTTCYSDYF